MVRLTSLLGRHLGRYHIQEEIGRGGMARVYRAYDPQLQRQIALKVLAPQLALDTEYIQRFQREAIIAANLHHPNIVTIYDVSEIDGLHFIAMEYIRGRSLHAIINERGALGLPNAVAIISAVGAALDYAHRQGAIHRDVKPHNIMINILGRVLLADFGIAQMPESRGDRLTRTGIFIGTPEYISPEQASARQVDGRSDLYSLGITAYELITGTVPFSGATPQLMIAHLQSPPPPLSTLDPQQPPELDSVLARSLAKNPDTRYQTGAAFAEALRQVARKHGLQEADAAQLAELALPRALPEGQVTAHVPTDETARQPVPPAPVRPIAPKPEAPQSVPAQPPVSPRPESRVAQDEQPTLAPVSPSSTSNQMPPANRRGLWIALGVVLLLGLGALLVQGREQQSPGLPTATTKPIPTLPTSTATASRVPSPSPSAVPPTFTSVVASPSLEPTVQASPVPTRRPSRPPTLVPAPVDTDIPATETPTAEEPTATAEPPTLTPTDVPPTLTPTLTVTPVSPTAYPAPPSPSPPPPTATPTVVPTTVVPTATTEPPSPTATALFTATVTPAPTVATAATITMSATIATASTATTVATTPSLTATNLPTNTASVAPATNTIQITDTPTP